MHIARGLYGVFLIDPKTPRPPAREMVMMMNGFDTDLDGGENEIYTVNGYANVYFRDYPIPVRTNELQRVYLVNITEFDLVNSMHTHATFFHLYPTGTSTSPSVFTDVVTLGQGERAILEFRYKFPGRYLFHAHQNEFAELGWLGQFEVKP
jgi:FtsP/CotA-like multicopper oxidase with cupredoxin domain